MDEGLTDTERWLPDLMQAVYAVENTGPDPSVEEYARAALPVVADAYRQGRADLAAKVDAALAGTNEVVTPARVRAVLAADSTPREWSQADDDAEFLAPYERDSTPREDQP